MLRFLILLLITMKASPVSPALGLNLWVVWNIGQGQWVTHVINDECRHFDMGGEVGSFASIRGKILQLCGNRTNEILLSHWDLDHFSNIKAYAKAVPQLCWLSEPKERSNKVSVAVVLRLKLKPCMTQPHLKIWRPFKYRSLNESSVVYQDEDFLMPGDSTTSQEKFWALQMKSLDQVKILVLGHHGSRTSSGSTLLRHLPHLRMAIASARLAKYHHPHTETLARLEQNRTPVIKTEDWGNLYFNY